jgi:hypothetical protein
MAMAHSEGGDEILKKSTFANNAFEHLLTA